MAGDEGVAAPPVPRYYTLAEVAGAARLSVETVRRDVRAGALKARRKRHASRGWRVEEGELLRWLADEFEDVVAR